MKLWKILAIAGVAIVLIYLLSTVIPGAGGVRLALDQAFSLTLGAVMLLCIIFLAATVGLIFKVVVIESADENDQPDKKLGCMANLVISVLFGVVAGILQALGVQAAIELPTWLAGLWSTAGISQFETLPVGWLIFGLIAFMFGYWVKTLDWSSL